jgi:hypothetical protein
MNLDTLIGFPIRPALHAIAINFNRLVQATVIRMLHDIGYGFIDRPDDSSVLFLGKSQAFHQRFQSAAYDAEQRRVTTKLKLQQEGATQFRGGLHVPGQLRLNGIHFPLLRSISQSPALHQSMAREHKFAS